MLTPLEVTSVLTGHLGNIVNLSRISIYISRKQFLRGCEIFLSWSTWACQAAGTSVESEACDMSVECTHILGTETTYRFVLDRCLYDVSFFRIRND